MEIWKDVYDFPQKYEISNKGRLKNKITNHIYKMTNRVGGYFTIILYDKNHKRTARIHRLVAEAFIDNPNNYPCVNHKDLNKQNNCVENLEWCTSSYNTKHAISSGIDITKGLNKHNKNKFKEKYGRLYQYDKDMQLMNIYENLDEAYRKTNICKRNILQCINHQQGRKQAGGYIWQCEKEVMSNG